MTKAPGVRRSADCVLRGVVLLRDGRMGLGDCFSNANPEPDLAAAVAAAREAGGRVRSGRLAGEAPGVLDLARAGQGGPARGGGVVRPGRGIALSQAWAQPHPLPPAF